MLQRIVSGALVVASFSACSLPALDASDFRSKATAAAEEAISQANTAILATRLLGQDRLPEPNAIVLLEDAERSARAAAEDLSSVLPPDARSDRIRADVLPIVADVADLLARMRFAARRGDGAAVVDLRSTLADRVAALQRWLDSA